jgi:hypothetical protein
MNDDSSDTSHGITLPSQERYDIWLQYILLSIVDDCIGIGPMHGALP